MEPVNAWKFSLIVVGVLLAVPAVMLFPDKHMALPASRSEAAWLIFPELRYVKPSPFTIPQPLPPPKRRKHY